MARSDTIRALERRGMARPLAAKAADAGEQLGTLKNASLAKLRKLFNFREILELHETFVISGLFLFFHLFHFYTKTAPPPLATLKSLL